MGGEVVVTSAPPAEQVEAPPAAPYSDAVWIEGYWQWNGVRYVWIGGHYERPRPGYVWVRHHWVAHRRGWRYMPGHWRRY